MVGTVIATTESGSSYVLWLDGTGVRWFRVPTADSLRSAAGGWQEIIPRVVPGERLLLGELRSTPVVSVAFLPEAAPAPEIATSSVASAGALDGMLGWLSRSQRQN